jgi:hypothetical protein
MTSREVTSKGETAEATAREDRETGEAEGKKDVKETASR